MALDGASEREAPERDVVADDEGLPASCFRGPFKSYRQAVARSTEACDAYHFLTYAVVAGCVVGRRAYVHLGQYLFPNIFGCLVGPTGRSRKTTAIRFGRQLLSEFLMIATLTTSSWEGLLDALDGEQKRLLMLPGEFRSLANKARQEGTSNLIPGLTEAYDCPPNLRHKTRGKDLAAVRPFVSILTASTMEWFQGSIHEADIAGGFLNRWVFVDGNPKEPMPFPEEPNSVHWNIALKSLHDMDARLRLFPENTGLLMGMTKEACDRWAEFYREIAAWKHPSELLAQMAERIQDVVFKLALIYALLEGKNQIDREHIEAGIAFAEWERSAHARVFAGYGDSDALKLERRVLSVLAAAAAAGSKSISQSELHRRVGGRWESKRLVDTLRALEASGRIFTGGGKRGKYVGLTAMLTGTRQPKKGSLLLHFSLLERDRERGRERELGRPNGRVRAPSPVNPSTCQPWAGRRGRERHPGRDERREERRGDAHADLDRKGSSSRPERPRASGRDRVDADQPRLKTAETPPDLARTRTKGDVVSAPHPARPTVGGPAGEP